MYLRSRPKVSNELDDHRRGVEEREAEKDPDVAAGLGEEGEQGVGGVVGLEADHGADDDLRAKREDVLIVTSAETEREFDRHLRYF